MLLSDSVSQQKLQEQVHITALVLGVSMEACKDPVPLLLAGQCSGAGQRAAVD